MRLDNYAAASQASAWGAPLSVCYWVRQSQGRHLNQQTSSRLAIT